MFRPDIIAGKAVIIVSIQDTIDRQLRSLRAKLRRFATSLSTLGGDLFRFGATGLVGSFFPIRDFIQFQDQILFLQTKLQASDAVIKGLEITIRNLGKTTSFTSQEVAMAATELAKADFSAREIKDTLQSVLDLGRGAQIPLEEAASLLANTIKTFGIETSRAGEIASNFIVAARKGTLDVIDLKESIKETSGTLVNLNATLPETLSLITALSFSSLKGTKAGTSLNTLFLNLTRNADKLKEQLGIDIQDELGNFRGVSVVLTELEESLKGLGDVERTALIADLFNIRGGRAEAALFLRGINEVNNTIKEIKKSTDEARESAVRLDSKLGGVFRRARSAFQELLITIGATEEGPLTKLGESLRKLFNEISRFAQKNPELMQTLILIPPLATAAGVAFLTLGFALNKLASALTPVISLNRGIFGLLSSGIGLNLLFGRRALRSIRTISKLKVGLSGFFAVLSQGMKLFLSPSGLLVVLEVLILLGDKLKATKVVLEFLSKIVKDFLKDITELFKAIGPGLDILKIGLSQIFRGDLAKGIETLKLGIKELIQLVGISLSAAWERLLHNLKPVIDTIKFALENIFRIIRAIAGVAGQVAGAGKGLIPDIPGLDAGKIFTKDTFRTIFTGVIKSIEGVGIILVNILGTLQQVLSLLKSISITVARTLESSGLFLNPVQQFLKQFDPFDVRRTQIQKELRELSEGMPTSSLEALLVPGQLSEFIKIVTDPEKRARIRELNRELKNLPTVIGDPTALTRNAEQNIKAISKSLIEEIFRPGPVPQGGFRDAAGAQRDAQKIQALTHLAIVKLVDKAQPAMDKFVEGLGKGEMGLKAFFKNMFVTPIGRERRRIAEQRARDLATLTSGAAAIVGSFASTRRNLVKVLDVQEKKQTEFLEEIAENTKKIADEGGAFV